MVSNTDVEDWQRFCLPDPERARPHADNLWMITSGVLIIAMNAAFGLLESGCVQHRNSLNIMMKNITDLTVGGLAWWLCGYALAFCSIDSSSCKQDNFPSTIGDHSHWFFQWTFAATAATIDSGAVAERIAFIPYVLLSFVTTGVTYPYVVRWTWGGGFLSQFEIPFYDYAGGAVVHMLGGFSGLVAIMILGPRIGRFSSYSPYENRVARLICRRSAKGKDYHPKGGEKELEPVTDPIPLIWGTFFLWFGWYGFNPGAAVEVDGKGTYVIGRIVVNTTLGAIGGGCCSMFVMLCAGEHRIRAEGLAIGLLSGLAGVTAGCKWFGNGVAFLVGCLGNLAATLVKELLVYLCLDDVVSAVPVHLGGGLIGTIAIGFFAEPWACTDGVGDKGPVGVFFASAEQQKNAWRQVAMQFLGVAVIGAWASAMTFVVLAGMNQVPWLRIRVPLEQEINGIDSYDHGRKSEEEAFRKAITGLVRDVSRIDGYTPLTECFRRARRGLDFAKEAPSSTRSGFDDSCAFFVEVRSLHGANPTPQCGGVYICVEAITSGDEEEDSVAGLRQLKRVRKLRTEWTKVARTGSDGLEFGERFEFDPDMSKGEEEFVFALFTIYMNGFPTLQAHKKMMQAGISLPDDRGMKDTELKLYRAQERSNCLELVTPARKWAEAVLEAPDPKLVVSLGCPVGSRFLEPTEGEATPTDGSRVPFEAPEDMEARLRHLEKEVQRLTESLKVLSGPRQQPAREPKWPFSNWFSS